MFGMMSSATIRIIMPRVGIWPSRSDVVENDIWIGAYTGVDMPLSGRYKAKAGIFLPFPDAKMPEIPVSQASVSDIRLHSGTLPFPKLRAPRAIEA
jgi:hypothetical protein